MPDFQQRNLSIGIIKRFLKGAELEAFLKDYNSNRKSPGSASRHEFLQNPISDDDMELLRFYCLNTDQPILDYAKEHGMTGTAVYGRVLRIAVRYLAQHPELLDEGLQFKTRPL